jgi:hypothetical protein
MKDIDKANEWWKKQPEQVRIDIWKMCFMADYIGKWDNSLVFVKYSDGK